MEIRKDIIVRFGILYFLVAGLGVVIAGGILKIQNVKTDRWKGIARDIKDNTEEIAAIRGNICADDGSVMATSIPYYEIRFDLKADRVVEVFPKSGDLLAKEMADFFGTSLSGFKKRLNKAFSEGNRWFLLDEKRLNYNELQEFKRLSSLDRRLFGSGLIIIAENKRILPHGELGSRTIGTLNKGVFGGIHGNIGFTGIEGMQESFLAGANGKALKRNYSGRWVNTPLVEPEDGRDIITTINVNLQDYAHNALMKQMEKSQAVWGTAVVMEVESGDIKAIANIGRKKDGGYAETYNYAFGHAGCSEPGSTFKLMSLMVAMDDGHVDTCDVFDVGSGVWEYKKQKIYDSDYHKGGHGAISVKRIFELSSNVGTAKVITKYYEGREREFIDRIYKFGLNKPLGLGIMGEGVPAIKYPGDSDWWGPSLAWISYGYEIKLTPLQTLTFYNAVANNGKMVKPRFVSEVRENGMLVKSFKTEVLNPNICSQQTLLKAQDMLRGVCANGTGKSLQSPYYDLAGKTGTAVIAYDNEGYLKGGKKNYQASFAGYFPAHDPKYSCIVVIVGPQGAYYGGSVAGPVFREVADKVYATFLEPKDSTLKEPVAAPAVKPGIAGDIKIAARELDLTMLSGLSDDKLYSAQIDKNKISLSEINVANGTIPDVIGMGAGDALYLLENLGVKVRFNGFGSVWKQSVLPGNPILGGETVVLDLAVGLPQPVAADSSAVINGEPNGVGVITAENPSPANAKVNASATSDKPKVAAAPAKTKTSSSNNKAVANKKKTPPSKKKTQVKQKNNTSKA